MTEPTTDDSAPSDAELISAVRAGNNDAYGTLFARHRDAALRMARQLVPAADADDLVSESFVKVLDQLRAGGGPDVAFRAYLLTAIRRTHIDRIRRDQKVRSTDEIEKYDTGVEFDDTAVAAFESSTAARAFASLPERWQLVLWHLDVEGAKPADVAPLLGMTANGVSALAYRAREGLRQAYLRFHLADTADEECRWTTEHLGAYVRGGLGKRDSEKVRAHLDSCSRCAAVYLELVEVNSGLRGLLVPVLLGSAGVGYVAQTVEAAGAGAGAAATGPWGRVRDWASSSPANGLVAAGVTLGIIGAAAVAALALTSGNDQQVTSEAPRSSTPSASAPSSSSSPAPAPAAPPASPSAPSSGLPNALVPPALVPPEGYPSAPQNGTEGSAPGAGNGTPGAGNGAGNGSGNGSGNDNNNGASGGGGDNGGNGGSSNGNGGSNGNGNNPGGGDNGNNPGGGDNGGGDSGGGDNGGGEPPTAPVDLSVDDGAGGFRLSWSAVTGAEGYRVYRSSDTAVAPASLRSAGARGTLISGSTPIADTFFIDKDAPNGASVTYEVVAVNKRGDSPAGSIGPLTTPVTGVLQVTPTWSRTPQCVAALTHVKLVLAAVNSCDRAVTWRVWGPSASGTNWRTLKVVGGGAAGSCLRIARARLITLAPCDGSAATLWDIDTVTTRGAIVTNQAVAPQVLYATPISLFGVRALIYNPIIPNSRNQRFSFVRSPPAPAPPAAE